MSQRARSETCAVLLPEYFLKQFYPAGVYDEVRSLFRQTVHIDPHHTSPEETAARLKELNAQVHLVGWGSYPLAEDHPIGDGGLAYICNTCGGVRNLVSRSQIERGLLITDWGASISHTVAEAALMLLLACSRKMVENFDRIRVRGEWGYGTGNKTLFKKEIGIHGFGRVAQSLVRLLKPFDAKVTVFAPGVPGEFLASHGVSRAPSIEALFAGRDAVVELEALTAATEGIVTAAHLRSIREGGCFVNVARAGIVDEAGLIAVALEGNIHFGLDVFHIEPLALDSPLRSLTNVTVTPHTAGPTPDTFQICGRHGVDNLRRWVAGEPLDAVVDLKRFDLMT